MRVARFLAVGLAVLAGAPALAESVVPIPAELPPADYSARVYVDSLGCAYQRAGVSGTLIWVPRTGADRKPVCGKTPSLTAATATAGAGATMAVIPVDSAPSVDAVAAVPTPKVAPPLPADLALVESRSIAKRDTRCSAQGGKAQRYLISDGRRVTKCGAAVGDSLGFLNGLAVPDLNVSRIDLSPAAVAAAKAAGKNGYRLAWTNGALRPARADTLPAAALTMKWVQVGAFAQPANAERAVANLKNLGLPVARTTLTVGGKKLSAILAGPFATPDDLAAALDRLRKAGFAEAFPRR